MALDAADVSERQRSMPIYESEIMGLKEPRNEDNVSGTLTPDSHGP